MFYYIAIAPGMTINCGQTAGLLASPTDPNATNFLWYDVPVGGLPLDTGNMFVTPVLTQNKTYYVEMNDLVITRDTFYYTGSLQMFTVPANVSQLHVDMYGAQGAGLLSPENAGGLGGRVRFTMPVSTGEVYYLAVGGKGNSNLGGFNGGGGCTTNPTCNAINGFGGGGASDIRTSINLSDRIAVAGGGGGAGFLGAGVDARGGAGGGLLAGDAIGTSSYLSYLGKGGTQLSGGLVGTVNTTASGATAGTSYQGGNINPTTSVSVNYGGGGGGGGGAGNYSSSYGGGGGGGSSYTSAGFTNVVHDQGVRQGDGMIVISYGVVTCSSNRLAVPVSVIQNVVTPIVSGVSVMCGDTAQLVATGSVGKFEWYDSYNATTPIAIGDTFRYGPVMNNKTFYVRSVDNYANPVCVSEKIAVLVETFPIPRPIASSIINTQCGSSATIAASGSTGNYWWYDAPTGGNYLGKGSSYTTSNLFADTTFYYVEAISSAYPYVLDSIVFDDYTKLHSWIVPFGVDSIDVDVFGAQGGSHTNAQGGLGGRVKARIPVTVGQTLYIGVGSQPTTAAAGVTANVATGGTNSSSTSATNARGGGGLSDIRLINGTPINASQVLVVAGAGGGAGQHSTTVINGGAGGDTLASDGQTTNANISYGGKGGSQIEGGLGGNNSTTTAYRGLFYKGGNGYSNAYAGGGGGYYGGGGGYSNSTGFASCGGGGSSYTTPEASNVQHFQGVNTENGKVIIYYPRLVTYCSSERTKIAVVTNQLPTPTAIHDTVVCSDSAVIGVTGATGKYRWFVNANDYYAFSTDSVLTFANLQNDTTFYVEAVDAPLVPVNKIFTYTNQTEEWTVPADVYEIEVEVEGAQGGTNGIGTGGLGAKVFGIMQVTPGQTLYINVGQQPTSTSGGYSGAVISGGNGVGAGRAGGGASDIRLNGNTINDRVIVAGAGGGNGSASASNIGGAGGQIGDPYTTAAQHGFYSGANNVNYSGQGASLNAPGLGATLASATTNADYSGKGGNGSTTNAGGGGGYYGGGGGSSYADPNIVSNIAYLNSASTTHQGNGKVIVRYAKPVYNICESNKVPYIIFVDSLAAPVVAGSTTICNQGSTTFTASGGSGTYRWYENDSLVATTANYTTGNRITSTSVKVNYVSAQGCVSAFASGQLDIVNLPAATITSAPSAICISTDSIQLTTASAGGNWIGSAITSTGYFKPALATIGNNAVIYSIHDAVSGCFNNDTVNIVVDDVIAATITTSTQAICQSLPSFNVTAQNAGGNWSGNGIVNATNGEFNPSIAGLGTHTVYYEVVNGLCTTKDSVNFIVTATPVAQITNAPSQLCLSANPLQLTTSAAGGTWTGTGVATNGLFDPFIAAAGTHRVYYTVSSNGCIVVDSADIQVINAPIAQITTPSQQVCIVSNNIPLQANPAGGTWSGNGIVGNDFNPTLVTAVMNRVYYQVSGGGCTSIDTLEIDVVAMPSAAISSPFNVVCANDVAVNLQAATAGGTWSGNFVSSTGQLDVTGAGVGTHRVYYSVSNTACTALDSLDIVVNALPNVTITYPVQQICANAPSTQYFATPSGGVWSGAGIVNNLNGTFSPALATVGNHELYYTYTDAVGCTAVDTMYVEVASIPTANFISDNGCVNLDVNFTDLSTNLVGAVATWNWSFGNDSVSTLQHPSMVYTQAGTYVVTLKASTAAGCLNTITKTIQIGNAPDASFNAVLLNDYTTVNFYPIHPEIGANYLWTFGDGYSAASINASHTYELAGNYTACLTIEKNGCSQKVCNDITTTRNVSMKDEAEVSFNVYPNPFINEVNIQIKQTNAEKVSVSLFDITGRMIMAPRLIANGTGEQMFSIELDEFNLSDGVYNLVLQIDGVAHSTLLIKK